MSSTTTPADLTGPGGPPAPARSRRPGNDLSGAVGSASNITTGSSSRPIPVEPSTAAPDSPTAVTQKREDLK